MSRRPAPRRRRGRQALCRRSPASACSAETMSVVARLRARDRGRARRRRTARHSSPPRRRPAAARSSCSPAREEAQLSALGVISGFHEPDGIVGDMGGGSLELVDVARRRGRRRRHAAARRPGAAGPQRRLAEEGSEDRARGARAGARAARAPARPDLLRRRRHLARAGAPASGGARLSAARHARLHHRARATGSTSSQLVERVDAKTLKDIESRLRGAPAAARLRRDRARGDHPPRPAEARSRSRRSACARACSTSSSTPDAAALDPLIAAASDLNLLRSRSPRHGEELLRLDRPLHRDRRPAGDRRRDARCATPPACSPISAGARIPIIAASRASTSSPTPPSSASTIPAAPISALSIFFRHEGCRPDKASSRLKALAGPRLMERARLLGGADARRLSGLGRHGRRAAGDAAPRARPRS